MNLRELLRPPLVAVDVAVDNCEDAIRAVGQLMVNEGAVEPRFIDAMIRVKNEFGPYIVVAPGIALPHARPEDGVIKSSIAIMSLATPVNFGNKDNDPVFLLVALAAKDNKGHIEGLAELAEVLGQEKNVEDLQTCKTTDELLKIFLSNNSEPNDEDRG